ADLGHDPFRVADAELAAWIDAIENDKEPVVTAQQAFIVTQVLEAIYKSAETGQTIQL
ncbi:gfo/Idh/MocA family oxidoreductase, partial [Salmonella enterica]|nr:gfo/Idh/MocA family oxidoreductase [Salmonella enterica]